PIARGFPPADPPELLAREYLAQRGRVVLLECAEAAGQRHSSFDHQVKSVIAREVSDRAGIALSRFVTHAIDNLPKSPSRLCFIQAHSHLALWIRRCNPVGSGDGARVDDLFNQ